MSEAATHPPKPEDGGLKRRPAWLRALGHGTPPPRLDIAGQPYHRAELFKHDAFAATALYEPARSEEAGCDHAARPIVVKFCRQSSAFGVPLGWFGRYLARKERRFYDALSALDAVPDPVGPIAHDGLELRHAFGHVFVPGRTLPELAEADGLRNGFFAELFAVVDRVHAQRIAVVDLNKAENVIVDDSGDPHLLDFQLSVLAPAWWPRFPLTRWWLNSLQRSDRYHLAKHWRRYRPDEFAQSGLDVDALRPGTVRFWRKAWRPVILLRRRLFVALGVRRGPGTADTELSAEDADRIPASTKPSTPKPDAAKQTGGVTVAPQAP